MSGWIKIYRDINTHWIWDDPVYFRAWITILLSVNHEDKTAIIEKELIECKRGQCLYSLNGWAKAFGKGWTIQKTRTFFNLLQNDKMIVTEGLRKTTRLTVCNYENYQNGQQADNNLTTDRQQPDNIQITTTKEYKNDKNDKKVREPNKSAAFLDLIIDEFSKVHGNYEILNRGKERAAAGKLIKHYKEKFPGANSEETVQALSKYFAACVKIDDAWLQQNMSLPTIINKFNEINTILRNGKARRNNSRASDGSTLEDVIRDQSRKLGITK